MEEKYIDFAADEWYDHHRRKIVWFTAIIDEKTINCGISIEALRDHFGAFTMIRCRHLGRIAPSFRKWQLD